MTEPLTHTAGDTLSWREDSLTDYPSASGWALAYRLIGSTASHSIAAVGDSAGYAVTVTAATTATWAPGAYTWVATVSHGDGRRFTVAQGLLTVKPNLASVVGGMDLRGPARQALDAVDALLREFGAKAYLQEVQYGERRQRFRSPSEFMQFRSLLQLEARREDAAAGLAPRTSNRLLVRMTRQ
jgi:hypothetical protein